MDVLKYVNSKDVRDYLKIIGYEFSPVEAAWLIFNNHKLCLRDRHEAWNEIIASMPDMKIRTNRKKEIVYDSLHKFLQDYISMEQKWLDEFFSHSEEKYYSYVFRACDDSEKHGNVFDSYDICLKNLKEDISDYEYTDTDIVYISVIRVSVNEGAEYELSLDTSMKIKSVYKTNQKSFESAFYNCMRDMWFLFPVPFKKGDIVYEPGRAEKEFCSGPFVLEEIAPDYYAETGREPLDDSDMFASGVFQNEDGYIYHEVMFNYMDLEYYPEEKLTEKKTILKAVSNYMKGNISLGLFANAYVYTLMKGEAENYFPDEFTEEGLSLAGLVNTDEI